jgi:hypothetical protein
MNESDWRNSADPRQLLKLPEWPLRWIEPWEADGFGKGE